MADHLLLVDCSAFAYRAYYSLPARRRQNDGEPTGAVLGFMSMIWRMLGAAQADPPTYAAAVFDAPGGTFRHQLFPAYKGGRDPARALELEKQLPLMRPVAEVLGLTPIERKGFEADDVIATLAYQAKKAGIRSTIVSSDKDFGQLVEDGWVEIVDPMQRARDPSKSPRKLEADVLARFGVAPALVPQVQALAGDPVDSIPGVPGIGLETAARLIRRFGNLEAVLKRRKETRGQVQAQLVRHGDKAKLYLKLTTLRRNVPLKVDFEAMRLKPIIQSHLSQVVKAIDPSANITELFGLDRREVRTAPRVKDPYEWWREELQFPGQTLPEIPQCGFYQRRLVRGGPWVPARIWREPKLDADGNDTGTDLLLCEVGGQRRDAYGEFAALSMHPIKASDFDFEKADAAHAKAFRPDSPKANPTKPIAILDQPVPTNPRRRKSA